jgi:hypothetical protein
VSAIPEPSTFVTSTSELLTRSEYVLVLTNVGGVASSGTITVRDRLPEGVTAAGLAKGEEWSCTGPEGQSEVTCTTEVSVAELHSPRAITVPVSVAAGAPSVSSGEVRVSGGVAGCGEGGSPPCPTTVARQPTRVNTAPEGFSALQFTSVPFDASGNVATQAAAGFNGLYTAFDFPTFNRDEGLSRVVSTPISEIKQIVIDLPPGVIGDARVAPACPLSDVVSVGFNPSACPPATQLGTLNLVTAGNQSRLLIFNVVPEHGYPAEFGVYLPSVERAVLLYGTLGPGPEYASRLISSPSDRFVEIDGIASAFFGVPALADEVNLAPAAFFTNSSDCQAPGLLTSIHVDSWQNPGRFNPDGTPDFSDPNWKAASSVSPPVTGCESLRFDAFMSMSLDTTAADAPAALNVGLSIPQSTNVAGLATPPLRDITIALPKGLSVSPSSADGLEGCSDTQVALDSNAPAECPAASQIGTLLLHTPLLANPVEGQIFLATPECDPCTEAKGDPQSGRMVRLFMQVHSSEYGITVKLPGTVSVSPTGQLSATFKDNPQLPFEDLKVQFKNGPRAALSTPPACGNYPATADLKPWSAPQTPDVLLSPSISISSCASSGSFSPGFTAGTLSPQAKAYSPFTLTLTRNDGEAELRDLEQTLPTGLTAKIAGVTQCASTQAAAGECPPESQIGTVTVGVGPGTNPFYTTGKIFLTGPYNNGPFGEVVVIQAVAGPFNLGTVIVRGSIRINPTTAQATVVSDPFPTILDGIPLQTRFVNVTLNRPAFTLNATGCTPRQVTATVASLENKTTAVSSPYQAANCASLPFNPTLTASTTAKTSKTNGASLHVKLTSNANEANIAKAKVDLPIKLPSRLSTIQKACPDSVFTTNPAACPPGSLVGTARLTTPLLTNPFTGPAYLVSHGGAAFPDLVIVLQGEGFTIQLDSQTNIKKGITSSSFAAVPDEPFTTFELTLPQGPHSQLAAYGNLCTGNLNMPTLLTGQNATTIKRTTRITVTNCPKTTKHHTTKHHTTKHTKKK